MKRTRHLAAAASALAGLVFAAGAAAHGDASHAAPPRSFDAARIEDTPFGRAGDPAKVVRTIRLEMSDAMRFTPAHITVRRGETVRLVARNQGRVLHELVLGTADELSRHAALMKQFPDMQHDEPHMTHVKPGERGEIVWQFTQAGEFRFACLIPGHFEAGMSGRITVDVPRH